MPRDVAAAKIAFLIRMNTSFDQTRNNGDNCYITPKNQKDNSYSSLINLLFDPEFTICKSLGEMVCGIMKGYKEIQHARNTDMSTHTHTYTKLVCL